MNILALHLPKEKLLVRPAVKVGSALPSKASCAPFAYLASPFPSKPWNTGILKVNNG